MRPSIDATQSSSDVFTSNLSSETSPKHIALPPLTDTEYNRGLSLITSLIYHLPVKLRKLSWPERIWPSKLDDPTVVCRTLSKLWEKYNCKNETQRREICSLFRNGLPKKYKPTEKVCPCIPLIKSPTRLLKLIKRMPVNRDRFSVAFEDDRNLMLRAFITFLNTVTMKGSGSEYYSRSGIIVQSSCSGKSRMAVKVADILPVVYACCREKDDQLSYPPKTPVNWDVLINIPKGVGIEFVDIFIFSRCIAFLNAVVIACISVIKEASKMSAKDALNFRRKFLTSQYNKKFWIRLSRDAVKGTEQIFNSLKEVYMKDKNDGRYWGNFEKTLKAGVKTKFLPHSFPQISMLLCIDESKLLSNIFPRACKQSLLAHIHRASRYVPQGFALVFMDTLADLNILLRNPFKLTAPQKIGQKEFIFTDLMNTDLGHLKDGGVAGSLKEANEIDFICGFGRPVWRAGRMCGDGWDILLKEAVKRLLSCQNVNEYLKKKLLTIPAATAIMANRVNLDLDAALNTGVELVSSHLAYVNAFTQYETFTKILYTSDPMLSYAAQYLLTGKDLWQPCLQKISYSIRSGLIHVGERGEIAAQLVICHIIDNILKKPINRYLKPNGEPAKWITLEAFLKAFDKKLVAKIPKGLKGAVIHLNHFIKADDYVPNRADLVRFVCRGAGVVLKNNCPGADLIIPLVLKKPWRSLPSEPTTFVYENPPQDDVSDLISKSITRMLVDVEERVDQCTTRFGKISVKDADAFIKYDSVASSSSASSTPAVSIDSKNVVSNKCSLTPDHLSYVLIQVKNLKTQGAWPKNLSLLNPYSVGVDSIENLEYNRPYVAMGIQFTQTELLPGSKSKVIPRMNCSAEPPTKGRKKGTSGTQSSEHVMSFRVINPHFNFSNKEQHQEVSIRSTFDSIVNVSVPSVKKLMQTDEMHGIAYSKIRIFPLHHTGRAIIEQPSKKEPNPTQVHESLVGENVSDHIKRSVGKRPRKN